MYTNLLISNGNYLLLIYTFICVSHILYVTHCIYFNTWQHFIISLNNIQKPPKKLKIFGFFYCMLNEFHVSIRNTKLKNSEPIF